MNPAWPTTKTKSEINCTSKTFQTLKWHTVFTEVTVKSVYRSISRHHTFQTSAVLYFSVHLSVYTSSTSTVASAEHQDLVLGNVMHAFIITTVAKRLHTQVFWCLVNHELKTGFK